MKVMISKFLKGSLLHEYLMCWQITRKKVMSGESKIKKNVGNMSKQAHICWYKNRQSVINVI